MIASSSFPLLRSPSRHALHKHSAKVRLRVHCVNFSASLGTCFGQRAALVTNAKSDAPLSALCELCARSGLWFARRTQRGSGCVHRPLRCETCLCVRSVNFAVQRRRRTGPRHSCHRCQSRVRSVNFETAAVGWFSHLTSCRHPSTVLRTVPLPKRRLGRMQSVFGL